VFSLVWLVACGESSGSSSGDEGSGGGVSGGEVGTSGTTVSSPTTGNSNSATATTAVGAGSEAGGAGGTGSGGTGGSESTGAVDNTSGGETTGAGAEGGGAGSGGAAGDEVDCSIDPCAEGEVCVPNARGCGVTEGRCFEVSEAVCPSGAVCGCDGVIYDDVCEAYAAQVGIDVLSDCDQPEGTIACYDRFCEASSESCRVVNESRCDQGCLPLCPGMHTVTYGACLPKLSSCDDAVCDCPSCLPAVSCLDDEDGITFTCAAGCAG
jgi:hypothetical protein